MSKPAAGVAKPSITISVVSHGQGELIVSLLRSLEAFNLSQVEIILTLNIYEPRTFLAPFHDLPLRIIENKRPLGFGANHNQAFLQSRTDFFCIVNPDVRLADSAFLRLPLYLEGSVGAVGPAVVGDDNALEDSARRDPTFFRLFKRRILGSRDPDYVAGHEPIRVDWLAGMFVLFRREAFQDVGGFDERYFMYMEDADICRRLRRQGWSVNLVPNIKVVHAAQRASHRNPRHLGWHLRSIIRYLVGF